MRLKDFKKFLKVAASRKKSVENYFVFQRFQASMMAEDLDKYNVKGAKNFLDIGSGIGGYIYEFAERYPNTIFISLDLNPLPFAQQKYVGKNIFTMRGDASRAPVKDKSFDIVFASGVIEHITDQTKFLESVSRICKTMAYISFPPFLSPVGGHSLSPFHYLPGNLPDVFYKKFYRQKEASFKNYGLVKTTLSSMEKLSKDYFETLEVKPRFFDVLKPLIKIPIIREYVCPHIEFYLRPRSLHIRQKSE